MKRGFWSAGWLLALTIFVSTALAQDIQVSTAANIDVGDEQIAGIFQNTEFESTLVGAERSHTFRIHNTDVSTTLVVDSYVITDSTHFNMTVNLDSFNIAPNGFSEIAVNFAPLSAGSKSSTLIINSNDPDAENSYLVNLTGFAIAPPAMLAGIDLGVRLVKPVKPKLNKKTGLLSVKMKLEVNNTGTSSSATPQLLIFKSNTEVFTLQLPPLQTVDLKPLLGPVNGKIKKRKINIKLDGLSNGSAWLFAAVIDGVGPPDLDFTNNVVTDGYRGVGP